ncbi:MAG: PKD domain-containing protein, partial [Bacteroidetes bacterium]|nr:PKD domain-containing protein [Bacteroidota bacterium]
MKRCTTALAVLFLTLLTMSAQAQTGWGVARYEGFRADTTGNGTLNTSWSTGNLGNTWNEGEWVPYLLELKNVDLTNTNFSDITVCYDFTGGNANARFVDLVRGVQIGTTNLGSAQGWPSDTIGTAFPLTTRAQLETAQNNQGLTGFGYEYLWAGYKKIDVDTIRMNRDTNGNAGGPADGTRCFTITRQNIIDAYGGNIANVPNTTTFYIYFNLHLSQTFIWNNNLQAQLNAPPTDIWGGYLYGYTALANDVRQGSGFVSGSSGQTYLTLGNKTVPIPVPPQPAGQISGIKFHDINGNQVRDGGEASLDGWPIYVGTVIGGIPISDTAYTDNTGAWSLTGLPQSVYLISEELDTAPTSGSSSGYTNAAPAFAQTPPSEWVQTYPDNTSTGTGIDGVDTPAPAVLAGYGPYSWEAMLINTTTIGNIDFGNHVPAPVCAVYPADTTICDESQVTLTAQRIAQGTPPYSYLWSGPNNFSATTQSIVVPGTAPGTYTVTLTDANGLTSSGCSAIVRVFPIPVFSITGDAEVCELSAGNAYSVSFDPNSPVPIGNITAWSWSITGNGTITSSTNTSSVTVAATGSGSYTLTLTVTDNNGCTETVTRTITVKANPTCSITPVGDVCPGSTGNIFNAPNGAYTYAWSISGNGTINGSTTGQSVSVDAGNAAAPFTLTLTITETTFPFCTSTCSLVVNVQDIEPPTITCAADTTIECPAPGTLPFTTPTAIDNCDPNPTVTVTNTVTTPGSCPNEYSVTRTWTATDIYNNSASCSQTIYVVDTTPPTIATNASNKTVECDGNGNAADLNTWLASNGGASASDACGGVTWSNNFTALSDLCGATGSATV